MVRNIKTKSELHVKNRKDLPLLTIMSIKQLQTIVHKTLEIIRGKVTNTTPPPKKKKKEKKKEKKNPKKNKTIKM